MQDPYLEKNHGGDFLRRESLGLAEVLNLDHWVSTLVNDLEWPRLDILLDGGIVESSSDKTPRIRSVFFHGYWAASCSLDIEDSVGRVHGCLVLRSLTDKALIGGEGDERWCGKVTLLVGNLGELVWFFSRDSSGMLTDLNVGSLVVGDAGVGGSEIDANGTVVYCVAHDCGVM